MLASRYDTLQSSVAWIVSFAGSAATLRLRMASSTACSAVAVQKSTRRVRACVSAVIFKQRLMRCEGGLRPQVLTRRSAFVEKRHWAASIAAVPIPVVVIQRAGRRASRLDIFAVFDLGRDITARLI